jgi:CPA2 family monovalent cation:H+ antiporter-2
MADEHLITILAVALSLAFVGGLAARMLGLPTILGYLAAGVILSPYTPGGELDTEILQQVAEIGVIFLLFGVGLTFNISDLMSVRTLAVPGAILQAWVVGSSVFALTYWSGASWEAALVMGLAVSNASTVVIVRTVTDLGLINAIEGRAAVGWTVASDIITILILAVLPALSPTAEGNVALEGAFSVLRAAVFVAVMLVIGVRLLPHILRFVAMQGSRELFVLSVVVASIGIAVTGTAFGVSIALGAFVAGVTVSESETSHQAAADIVPLREAFAVLFFVSVGMLLDPAIVLDEFWLFAGILAAVVIGNGIIAVVMVGLTRYPARTAIILATVLANIGEFSFVVVNEGLNENIISNRLYSVLLAVAVVSIAGNQLLGRLYRWLAAGWTESSMWAWMDQQGPEPLIMEQPLGNHVVVCGYGRVGQLTTHALSAADVPFVAIDTDLDLVRRARAAGIPALWGVAGHAELIERADVANARLVIVTTPDEASTLRTIAHVRAANEQVPIVVRAANRDALDTYYSLGAEHVVVPEYEGGLEMMQEALTILGFDRDEAAGFVRVQREIHYGAGDETGPRLVI